MKTKRGITLKVKGNDQSLMMGVCSLLSHQWMFSRSQPMVNWIIRQWPSSLKTKGQMIGCWILAVIGSVLSEERSKWVDGIYLLYSDSFYPHRNQPITILTTIEPLFRRPTGRSKDPHRYQYHCIVSLSWFSWSPMLMNLCSMFRLFFIIIMSYHTFISQLWWFCLLLALLWFHCLHTPYCYLFLANWSMCCPALNSLVYS